MKELIKEIAEQSGIKYGSAVRTYYSHCTDGVQEDDLIKFAETIIRESAAYLDSRKVGCKCFDDLNDDAGDMLKRAWKVDQ